MGKTRELSQLGSLVVVDNSGNIGFATPANTSPNVGIGTDNPQFKLDVHGDVNFTGLLRQDGVKFASGVGIGSTVTNPNGPGITNRIGLGYTDISFVGAGMSVTGYGSTVVIDFSNLTVRAEAAIPGFTLMDTTLNVAVNTKYSVKTIAGVVTAYLPASKLVGDFIEFADTEATWDLNNLMIVAANNEQFKNYTTLVDSPLACDVAGATLQIVWQGAYWRVNA